MLDFRKSLIDSSLNKVLKRLHYPLEVMLTCVRWYVAYPLSLRHVEEMMRERGVFVDHTTVHWLATNTLAGVLPHDGMLLGCLISQRLFSYLIRGSGKGLSRAHRKERVAQL